MLRSSQPLTGPNGKRNKEDERLINAVLGVGMRGYIIDTRSQTAAKLATAKGFSNPSFSGSTESAILKGVNDFSFEQCHNKMSTNLICFID